MDNQPLNPNTFNMHFNIIHMLCLPFKFPSDIRNMESVSTKTVRRYPSISQTFVQAIFTVISEFSLIWWLQKFSAAQGWCYINIKLATGRFHFANFQSIARVSMFLLKIILVTVPSVYMNLFQNRIVWN